MKFLRIAAVPAILVVLLVPALVSVLEAQAPAAGGSSPVQLEPYTSPDQSASAGVPQGWKVTAAVKGAIAMAGPQGESVTLGNVFVAHDGPFQLGQRGAGGALLNMPSSAKLTDKLVMILQQNASLAGKPIPEVKFLYAAPLQMGAALGQCGMFVAEATASNQPAKGMGIFCSLPEDRGQFFKSVLIIGTAPNAIAVQTVPAVEAVFKSYRIAPGWAQRMFAPVTPAAMAAPQPGGGGADETQIFLRAMANNQRAMDIGFACADAGIIGNGSNWQTPRECGGYAPNP
jgi:hypothetical protein